MGKATSRSQLFKKKCIQLLYHMWIFSYSNQNHAFYYLNAEVVVGLLTIIKYNLMHNLKYKSYNKNIYMLQLLPFDLKKSSIKETASNTNCKVSVFIHIHKSLFFFFLRFLRGEIRPISSPVFGIRREETTDSYYLISF